MTKQEKLSKINADLTVAIAKEKAKRAEMEASYYEKIHMLQRGAQEMREVVYNEPDEPQTASVEPAAVWLNGEQWSCAVVARRILRKLPKLNCPRESFYIEISPSYLGGCCLRFRYVNTVVKDSRVPSCELTSREEPEEQAAKVDLWLKEVDDEMRKAKAVMDEERKEAGNE